MTKARIGLSATLLIALMTALVPSASASGAGFTCTKSDGTVVLKVQANGHATRGLQKAVAMTTMAQNRLGVTCAATAAGDTVQHKLAVRCARANGDVVLKAKASMKAFKGLDTSVKAFVRHAGTRLGLTCEVVPI
jgi:hypothetical protein